MLACVQSEAAVVGLSMASMKSIEANRRAFYRQLKKVVEKADVLLIVLDARDPMVRCAPSPCPALPCLCRCAPMHRAQRSVYSCAVATRRDV